MMMLPGLQGVLQAAQDAHQVIQVNKTAEARAVEAAAGRLPAAATSSGPPPAPPGEPA